MNKSVGNPNIPNYSGWWASVQLSRYWNKLSAIPPGKRAGQLMAWLCPFWHWRFEILVAEWWRFRFFYHVELEIGVMVAVVACAGQEEKAVVENGRLLKLNSMGDAVQSRVEHLHHLRFFSVGLVLLDILHCFQHFVDFKVGQFPVLILPGKPKFGMMYLYAAHEFSEARFVSASQFSL